MLGNLAKKQKHLFEKYKCTGWVQKHEKFTNWRSSANSNCDKYKEKQS